MRVSAIYRAGLDRGEIEMGFAMECNQMLMNIINYLIIISCLEENPSFIRDLDLNWQPLPYELVALPDRPWELLHSHSLIVRILCLDIDQPYLSVGSSYEAEQKPKRS